MSIYDLIREVLVDYPHNSDDTVAIEVLNRLRVARKAAEVLHPLVEAAVANYQYPCGVGGYTYRRPSRSRSGTSAERRSGED